MIPYHERHQFEIAPLPEVVLDDSEYPETQELIPQTLSIPQPTDPSQVSQGLYQNPLPPAISYESRFSQNYNPSLIPPAHSEPVSPVFDPYDD